MGGGIVFPLLIMCSIAIVVDVVEVVVIVLRVCFFWLCIDSNAYSTIGLFIIWSKIEKYSIVKLLLLLSIL